jgi:DNA-directed RNA polymerase alpha subunit
MSHARTECPLTHINLPKEAVNTLVRGSVRTLAEVAEWIDRDLLSLPNFGPASVASLRALLADTGALAR